jgi:drug/metabolite transporter (DMT)-like permease
VDAARGDVPSTRQWIGVALVVAGIVVLSRAPRGDGSRRVAAGAGLAVVAALGFGLFFVGIDAGADESAAWAVTAARLAAVPVVVAAALVTSATLKPPRAVLPLIVGVGVFDTGANVFFAAATTYGAVGIVAVLGSLYPIVTVVLAWLVLGEKLSAAKRAGGVIALAGAALVAAG